VILNFVLGVGRGFFMTFSFSKEFSSSTVTNVENAFINEYLPVSNGNAVKVYLYGLFLCQHPERDETLLSVAETLDMDEKEVLDCFRYWEEFGLLEIISEEPFSVRYVPVRSTYGAKARKIKADKYTEFTKALQALLPSRMISTNEYSEYFVIMETFGIKPEAMLLIVKYCIDLKGEDIGYRYISKVAKDFGARGLTTTQKIEKELSAYTLRTGNIQKIFQALSIKRQPELEDSELVKIWTQELEFEIENIIFAAGKLKKSSMSKLDAFIKELYAVKCFSKNEIEEYANKKQAVYDLAIKINKSLGIYVEVLDTEIENYVLKWISYGFDSDTLRLIASNCFLTGKKELSDMDNAVSYLYTRGFVSLTSVNDFYEGLKKVDEFICKILLVAGVNRRPNSWDRENVTLWKNWNFSEDMILEAAKLSAGKSSPLGYMTGILSNWKNNNVYDLASISNTSENKTVSSQEEYNREYGRRRSVAVMRAQKNLDLANAIDGFSDIYQRLGDIERDLAFAEINNNQTALYKFEQEKAELTETATLLLKNIGLTLEDLSPKYACEKCNDTGYVGTNRCDCFNKKVN